MKNIDWKQVGGTVKDVCTMVGTVVGTGLLIGAAGLLQNKLESMAVERDTVTGTYEEAVAAIMNSAMMSSYKVEAMDLLAKDEYSSYYKAVITIVNSDAMSSYKLDMIRSLSS